MSVIMFYWECQRRLDGLREFRKLLRAYFSNILNRMAAPPVEKPEAQRARALINQKMGEVVESCKLMGDPCQIYYSPPPLIGGVAGRVDLLMNTFELWRLRVSPQQLDDLLGRAIGDYERNARRLFWQMFNPFFWIGWLFTQALKIPFRILGAAGFNAKLLEASTGGRVWKAVSGFVIFAAALLEGLSRLGWLAPLKHLIASLAHRY